MNDNIDIIRRYCTEKKKWGKFKQAHPVIFDWVIDQTSFLPEDAAINQRLWHILENISVLPKCQNEDCSKSVKWYNGSYRKYCSVECSCKAELAIQKRNEAYEKKYGVKTFGKIIHNHDIRNKVKSTNLEKYGAEWSVESEHSKIKRRDTCVSKYGVDHFSKTQEFKDKNRKTLNTKYGVNHNMQISEVAEARNKSWEDKYGGHPFSNPEIREKIISTNILRYGAPNVMQNENIKSKVFDTANKKFNRNNPSQYNISDWAYERLENEKWLSEKRKLGWSFPAIAHHLGVDTTTVVSRFKKFNLHYEPLNIKVSTGQQEVFDYINSLGVKCQLNNRSVITPIEIDIFIPEKKLGIEYCGLYWHNELFLDKNYHKHKRDRMEEQGYQLITLFEDEWRDNREIVKSILKNKVGKVDNIIHARKCSLSYDINKDDINAFLNNNHLRGEINFSSSVGLYYEGILVSVMTFIIEGTRATLNRFCSKKNMVVSGSASKLLSFFIKNNTNIESILSFSDLRWSNGALYDILGFNLISTNSPDYEYVVNNNRYHKFLFRKNKMKRKLIKYDENLTEHENALINNIFRIYDCGKLKYELKVER